MANWVADFRLALGVSRQEAAGAIVAEPEL